MKRGIILMNLGSPDSTEVKDVKRYLDEFLMDERVIDYPWLFRVMLVKGIITPFRAAKSAKAYKTIWTKEGSPLVVLTRQLQQALQDVIAEPVEIAMRYGSLTPDKAFDALLKREPDIEEVIAVPLYPHYAMSSYETAVEHAKTAHRNKKYSFTLRFIKPFFDDPAYLDALADRIKPYLTESYDHILFSYHGIPARHIHRDDPSVTKSCLALPGTQCAADAAGHQNCYRRQVIATTHLVMKQLNIPKDKYSVSFQSRLGKGWLEPFTDKRLEEMPRQGIKKLLILCPAFVSDCLETLEEIEERGKETFLEAGGESYKMIPCLNVHPMWVKALKGWINEVNNGNKEMLLAE
jgi:protoporphyrin/coproporphyrin ferrochelatase